MVQIKHNKLRIPTGGRLTSWLITQRGGVDFGATEDKSIQWQGGGFEPGTSGFQVQRPTTRPRSPPMGTLGISHFSEKQWIRVIEWIAPEVEKIAKWSVEQSRKLIRARGDQGKLEVTFDGFYLTRGHYSNNASATMHDTNRVRTPNETRARR